MLQSTKLMKRLLLPLLAALALPTAVIAESDCFYSNQKEYEDCAENSNVIKKTKYPLEIKYSRPTKKAKKYIIWLITTSEELAAGPGSGPDSLLQIKSKDGNELEFIHGIWSRGAGGFAAQSSFILPAENILKWKKYTINNFVTYKITYKDELGEVKKIAFQQHIEDASRRKGSLFADLIEEISKLKAGESRSY